MIERPPKYDPRVYKYLDVTAEVDFDVTVSQFQPSDQEEYSMSKCRSISNNGFIYVDDEAISE
jgi:hypothetical protein